jgi:hypothetical protein
VFYTFGPPFPSLDFTKYLLALCSLEVLLGGEILYIDHNIFLLTDAWCLKRIFLYHFIEDQWHRSH